MELECRKKPLTNGYYVHIIKVSGGIDYSNDYNLYHKMIQIINEGGIFFLLDFSNTKYIDSTHLGFLIQLIDNGIKIKFAGCPKQMLISWDMLGLHSFFKHYKTKDEALFSFIQSFNDKEFIELLKAQKLAKYRFIFI